MMKTINDYCARRDSRKWMSEPFRIDDLIAATNGHRLCWHESDEQAAKLPEAIRPSITKLLDRHKEQFYQTLPEINIPEKGECRRCEGKGILTVTECDECDGEGEHTFRTDHNSYCIECASCEGDGSIEEAGGDETLENCETCENCAGTGKKYQPGSTVEICGIKIEPIYAVDLLELTDTKVAPAGEFMLAFRSEQFDGLIMGHRY